MAKKIPDIPDVLRLEGYNQTPPIITGDYEYILHIYTDDDDVQARQLSHKEIWLRNLKNLADIMVCFKNKNKAAMPIPQREEKSEKENESENPQGEVTV